MLTRFRLACPNGLAGKPIAIAGLEMTLTDVLIRLHRLDGTEETRRRLPTSWLVFTGLVVLLPMATGMVGMARYAGECFPVAVAVEWRRRGLLSEHRIHAAARCNQTMMIQGIDL